MSEDKVVSLGASKRKKEHKENKENDIIYLIVNSHGGIRQYAQIKAADNRIQKL